MDTPPEFSPGRHREPLQCRNALWFIVRDGQLLVIDGEAARLPGDDIASRFHQHCEPHYFGRLGEQDCIALNVCDDIDAPPGFRWAGLRSLFFALPEALLAIAGRALQIVEWDRSHRYCGRCGTATEQKFDERVKVCPGCGYTAYPRVSPAMMVLIRRDRELLLARAPHYPADMYSALAGFVEAGESVEETVHREVREEVGLRVRNLRYFGSQSWPFPHQLMIAFHAEYAGGELAPDPAEIAEARWFMLDAMPKFPSSRSISRRLIESGLAELRAESPGGT